MGYTGGHYNYVPFFEVMDFSAHDLAATGIFRVSNFQVGYCTAGYKRRCTIHDVGDIAFVNVYFRQSRLVATECLNTIERGLRQEVSPLANAALTCALA